MEKNQNPGEIRDGKVLYKQQCKTKRTNTQHCYHTHKQEPTSKLFLKKFKLTNDKKILRRYTPIIVITITKQHSPYFIKNCNAEGGNQVTTAKKEGKIKKWKEKVYTS